MIRISYKDWIAGRRHLKGYIKTLQEDILSDDNFPDSTHYQEMFQYLKKQKASTRFIRIFNTTFYDQYKKEILDTVRDYPQNKYSRKEKRAK